LAVVRSSNLSPLDITTRVSDLAELKRRDTAAWTRLFQTEHPFVYRAVLAQVGDRAVADDIAGQVFLEALEGIGRYRDRGKPMRAWLLAIARNRAADWFRNRSRETVVESVPDVLAPETPAPSDRLSAALDAMATLTTEQREVVYLRFVEGYRLDEVAQLTNRSAGAIKAMQHRALDRLRALLRDTPHAEVKR
jgi:RNA polymerase sigma-70 factor (ECF subfamily)